MEAPKYVQHTCDKMHENESEGDVKVEKDLRDGIWSAGVGYLIDEDRELFYIHYCPWCGTKLD